MDYVTCMDRKRQCETDINDAVNVVYESSRGIVTLERAGMQD